MDSKHGIATLCCVLFLLLLSLFAARWPAVPSPSAAKGASVAPTFYPSLNQVSRLAFSLDGLPTEPIEELYPTARGTWWLQTARGIFHYDPTAGTSQIYNEHNGLPLAGGRLLAVDPVAGSALRNDLGHLALRVVF